MKKVTVLVSVLLISLQFANAQTKKITPASMLEHIKKEKLRTPVLVETAIKAFEAESSTKKTRSQELKLTTSNSGLIEEGEAHIAINPANDQQLVMSFMNQSSSGLTFPVYYSNNGGDTWTKSSFNALTYLNQDFGAGTFAAGGGDPIFAYDNTGKLFFSWIYLSFNQNVPDTAYASMYLASSADNGSTWSLATDHFIGKAAMDINSFTAYGNSDGFYDRQWFAMDLTSGANANTLYCSFVYFPNMVESQSLVGTTVKKKPSSSASFNTTKYQVVSGASQFGNVAVDNTGKLHVTYCDLDQNQIFHKVSSNGGTTFSAPHLIYNGTNLFGAQNNGFVHDRENSATNMIIDGDNTIHTVWSDFPANPGPNYDSYYSRSTDGGNTWSAPTTLAFAGNKVLMPVVCASGKKVSIGGYGVNSSNISDYYMMSSTDNGASWGTPLKVSTQTNDFSSPAGRWYGDYFNAVRTDTKVYNIWSDGRSSLGGTKMYVSITPEWATGFTEISSINGSISLESLYPIPASEFLNLNIKSDEANELSLSIISIDGKVIKKEMKKITSGIQSVSVPLASLAKGNYLLQLDSKDGYRISRVFVKE